MTRNLLGLVVVGGMLAAGLFHPSAALAGSVEETLMKAELDWTDAMVKKDAKALDKIIADDWVSQNDTGDKTDKKQAMAAMEGGDVVIASMTNGPMTVRVFGDTAIVQGSDDEKSSFKGKDTSGKYTWLDVFVKRGGHWVAVASQNTKVTN